MTFLAEPTTVDPIDSGMTGAFESTAVLKFPEPAVEGTLKRAWSVAVFLVTVKEPSGAHSTSEIEADHYFTDDKWVTFWSSDSLDLPEPVIRFEQSAIVRVEGG
jgi:hypothetical protein